MVKKTRENKIVRLPATEIKSEFKKETDYEITTQPVTEEEQKSFEGVV